MKRLSSLFLLIPHKEMYSMVAKNMTTKHGQPRTGRKNARLMTRAECEVTDLPRWVQIYTSPATGETAFKNADIVGGAKTVYAIRKKLSKFWG
jgi:hypothetical protein|tara:strand:+ start:154 stop:432 length:279 start_codon:yes stop_codon:yes gene_type:complete